MITQVCRDVDIGLVETMLLISKVSSPQLGLFQAFI